MGWTWEVAIYVKCKPPLDAYEYWIVWTGESFFGALRALRKARKRTENPGAIRLVWRP